jgi:hypothetical protein
MYSISFLTNSIDIKVGDYSTTIGQFKFFIGSIDSMKSFDENLNDWCSVPPITLLRSIELTELKKISAKVELFADRLIAHLDRRGLPASKWPSYAELNKALSYLEQLREKYARFFYSDKLDSIIKFKSLDMKNDITRFIKKNKMKKLPL